MVETVDFSDSAALIVAAGRGSRFGDGGPKQYRLLGGRPVLAWTIEAFAAALPGAAIQVVIHPDDFEFYETAVEGLADCVKAVLRAPTPGGATRQESVAAGLEALASEVKKYVLIHDAARPFASIELIRRARASAVEHGAAAPGVAVVDTIKEVDGAGVVVATPPRAALRAVQTPQAFRFDLILSAHRAAKGLDLTDDSAVAERAGHRVHVFPGEAANMKITHTADLAAAERRLLDDLPDVRVGLGFDVHAFEPGDKVWLGGVAIAHTMKLEGHSDADVLAHAITDALLGAIAEGDIGDHFPPSDPQWKGAPSSIFLEHAAKLVRARGGMIANIDASVVAERPKIGPHRDAIRARIAEIVGIEPARVGLKATTAERLGFVGREEGIVAMATATVRLPLVTP